MVLPRALLEYTEDRDTVEVVGTTLSEAVTALDARFRGLRERVLDDQGRLRRFVHAFVNGDSIGGRDPTAVSLQSGDTVHLLPSVAGGSP